MDLLQLKKMIDLAIDDCQLIIRHNPKAVYSEGDLERLLSECISKRIGYIVDSPTSDSFAVYSQISHYNNEKEDVDARVDLLLMKPEKIIQDLDKNKRFVYKSDESFAIELKYRHADNHESVKAAKDDIDKYIRYKDDSYYYTVILLDKNDNTSEYKKEILDYYKKKKDELGREYRKRFFCRVLIKKQ